MNSALWWSGVFAWCFFGVIGLVWFTDHITDWVLDSLWSRKEFMVFVWDRLKSKKSRQQSLHHRVGGEQ